MSDQSGRMEIYVRPFRISAAGVVDADGRQWQVSTEGGVYPAWGPKGAEVYYLNAEGEMMAASIAATESSVEAGTPLRLFSTRILGGGEEREQGRQYDVAPDGRFLINTVLGDAPPITLLMNWNPEAKH